MLPWFAVASCHETTHDEAFKKKVSHATACYGLLTKEATKEVNLRSINADFLKFVVSTFWFILDSDWSSYS
jgi:hypothetical protein